MTQTQQNTADAWIAAVRASHDRLSGLLTSLDAGGIRARSYDTDWSIAQVASHLGSQAEIFGLFLDAGLTNGDLPGSDRFQQIWARWDGSTPEEQVRASIEANEAFVARVEGLTAEERDGFRATLFGNRADLTGLLSMRLAEHALHTWDVAVALDDAATVAPDAVALLTDAVLPGSVARASTPTEEPLTISVDTSAPERSFLLTTGPAVTLTPVDGHDGTESDASAQALQIPAEALLRLVSGRLDPEHTPAGLEPEQEDVLGRLRPVFPGF